MSAPRTLPFGITGLGGRYTSHHKTNLLGKSDRGTLLFSFPQTQSDLSTSFLQGIQQVYKQENTAKKRPLQRSTWRQWRLDSASYRVTRGQGSGFRTAPDRSTAIRTRFWIDILTQNNLEERRVACIRLDQGYHQRATSQSASLPVEQGTGMLDRAGRTWPCLRSTYLSVSNVVLWLPCRTILIELNSTLARQYIYNHRWPRLCDSTTVRF